MDTTPVAVGDGNVPTPSALKSHPETIVTEEKTRRPKKPRPDR